MDVDEAVFKYMGVDGEEVRELYRFTVRSKKEMEVVN
jgi:hypothetical protein